MKYLIYCRKSSESEERQMLSIPAQENELARIAEKVRCSIVGRAMKRTPIKRKAKRARTTKSGRVILDAKGMKALREAVFERADGRCQCVLVLKQNTACNYRCPNLATAMHHVVYRSHGGSDSLDNCLALCKQCHDDIHAGKGIAFRLP